MNPFGPFLALALAPLFRPLVQWLALLFIAVLSQFVYADEPTGFAEPVDVTFTADVDGSEQKYVLMLPWKFDADQSHDLMIAVHGHGSDRWQFAASDDGEMRACRDVAAANQMIYVSPDYRAKTSWMSPKAEADVVQIIADLKKQYKIDKVFITGASMGGSSCLTFTALHPDLIAGVASMNGTANHLEYRQFQDAIQESFGGTKAKIPEEYKKRSAGYWPEKLTMPVGISVGGKDELVPPESVRRLGAVLTALDRPVLVIDREEIGHYTEYKDAKRILEFVIEAANKHNIDE
ncbi:MAG: alpha/beta fold hydrolase [Planctomycetaceae bacterium]